MNDKGPGANIPVSSAVLTKRELVAAMILQGLVSNTFLGKHIAESGVIPEDKIDGLLSRAAVKTADLLLNELSK